MYITERVTNCYFYRCSIIDESQAGDYIESEYML